MDMSTGGMPFAWTKQRCFFMPVKNASVLAAG